MIALAELDNVTFIEYICLNLVLLQLYDMLPCLSYWQWHRRVHVFFSWCPVIKLMIKGRCEWSSWRWYIVAWLSLLWQSDKLLDWVNAIVFVLWSLESLNESASVHIMHIYQGQFRTGCNKLARSSGILKVTKLK